MYNCKPRTVSSADSLLGCYIAQSLRLYSSLPGSGLPVFTFSCMHVRVCVYVAAFARVHIRLCLVALVRSRLLAQAVLVCVCHCVYITAFARVQLRVLCLYTMTLACVIDTIYACVYVHWCLLSMPVSGTFTGAYYLCLCVRSLVPTIYACVYTFTGAYYLCLCVYVLWCLLSMPVCIRSLVPTIYACVYVHWCLLSMPVWNTFTGAYYLCLYGIRSLVPTIYGITCSLYNYVINVSAAL